MPQDELTSCLSPGYEAPETATPVPLPFAPGSKAADSLAGVADHLLSDKECTKLIELTTRRGYQAALVNVGCGRQMRMDDTRRSGRCIIDSQPFADELWRRLKPLLPKYLYGERSEGTMGRWEPVGLNERFRFLRYSVGDYFRPHSDGTFRRESGHPNEGDRSFVTLMIYLDQPEVGGETNFVNHFDRHNVRVTAVRPEKGMALFFEHGLLHEGAEVRRGVKHAIRTDVMYRRRPAPTRP